MAPVAFGLLLHINSACVSCLVSATQNSILEGFATLKCANSHFSKLLVQNFRRHYESLVFVMRNKSPGLESLCARLYAMPEVQARRWTWELSNIVSRANFHSSRSSCRSVPSLILFAELLPGW